MFWNCEALQAVMTHLCRHSIVRSGRYQPWLHCIIFDNNFVCFHSNLLPKCHICCKKPPECYLLRNIQRWAQNMKQTSKCSRLRCGSRSSKAVGSAVAASSAMSTAPALRATIAPNAPVWTCISGEKFAETANADGISTTATTKTFRDGHNSRFSARRGRSHRV